jgi:hypothetical protein
MHGCQGEPVATKPPDLPALNRRSDRRCSEIYAVGITSSPLGLTCKRCLPTKCSLLGEPEVSALSSRTPEVRKPCSLARETYVHFPKRHPFWRKRSVVIDPHCGLHRGGWSAQYWLVGCTQESLKVKKGNAPGLKLFFQELQGVTTAGSSSSNGVNCKAAAKLLPLCQLSRLNAFCPGIGV